MTTKITQNLDFKIGQIWQDRDGDDWKITCTTPVNELDQYPIKVQRVKDGAKNYVTTTGKNSIQNNNSARDLITLVEDKLLFKVGKKYPFRDAEGWAEFIIHVPTADKDERLVFVTDTGAILTRCITGLYSKGTTHTHDVMPEEYKEKFIPKIGEWLTRCGDKALVLGFNPSKPKYSLIGIIIGGNDYVTWTSNGRRFTPTIVSDSDLIEYLGPLPDHVINWGTKL